MADNQEQQQYWTSESGLKWIRFEQELDLAFAAVDEALIDRAQPTPGERVLDIGCGTGATARTIAQAVGSEGSVCAVDISEPLLQQARSSAGQFRGRIDYRLGDAQTDDFPGPPFDLVVSRFGSMFFSDPVAAFRNVRAHMAAHSRLVLAGWAKAEGNPWFSVPRDAAVSRLGPLESTDPNAPGPLGFQNIDHVTELLRQAAFKNVDGQAVQVHLRHPGPLRDLAALAANIGPAARILKKYRGGPDDVDAITDAVEAAFRAFENEDGVSLPANLNFFFGTAGDRDGF